MRPVFIHNDNIITSLGFSTREVVQAVGTGTTGILTYEDPVLHPHPVSLSRVDTARLDEAFDGLLATKGKTHPSGSFTRLEKMFLLSMHDALQGAPFAPGDPGVLPVISTTKGNIDLLEDRFKVAFPHKRLYLWEMARIIATFFGFRNTPLVVSNACISGVMALMVASRYIRAGRFDHAVVAGGDIVSEFVVSGFQSFQAMSPEPCKPFDRDRTGLSLGEGCGTIILSAFPGGEKGELPQVAGAATTNDANHISGPSRTGHELGDAINEAMRQATITPENLGYISAHGTATPFNDEMESKAFEYSGLTEIPVNSFKGYWGHTLGAAGIIESAAALSSMRNGMLYRSAGYENHGVPAPMRVITANTLAPVNACLKTASGFGGCNAAIVFKKQGS